jgi:hypothetical protein
MELPLDYFNRISFRRVVWLFPLAVMIHEAEEWNIGAWYQRFWVNLPPITYTSVWTGLVFSVLVIFLWTAGATLFRSSRIIAFLIFPWAAFLFLNALQHIYWTFLFGAYAPGVITAVLVIIPTVLYLVSRALRERHISIWFIIILAVVIVLGVVQTVKTGNVMTGQLRALHEFCIGLSRRLFG